MFEWIKDLWHEMTYNDKAVQRPRADAHGSARWAGFDFEEFGEYHDGVFLGILKGPPWGEHAPRNDGDLVSQVYSKPQTNVLICAPPGTGKGTTIIIPTLLDYQQSMFVIDPKGENAAVTMRTRREDFNQTVYVLNPWGMHDIPSSSINPLDILEINDINCVSNATFLTDLLMIPSGGASDSFWDESAKAVLVGLMLYIVGYEPAQDTLANLRRLVTLPEQEFQQVAIKMAASELFHGALAEAGGTILGMDPKTRANVRATAQAHTAFLADPVIKQATSTSDFNFRELKEKRTTVYVIIPAEHLGTQGRWLRLMVGMALTAIERGPRFDVRTLFLIDEFPALGRMQKIETGVATLRGYGVDFALACQDLAQLRNVYGTAAETLLANCTDKYFCRISDLNTAQMLSSMLGNETIMDRSESTSHQPGQPKPSTSVSWSSRARPLMMPEELLNAGPDLAFLIRSGEQPIRLQPCPYYTVSGFRKVADPNPFVPESYITREDEDEEPDEEQREGQGHS